MSETRIEQKEAFRFVGFKTALGATGAIHDAAYSGPKTDLFKTLVQNGKMAQLRPLSESPFGFAALTTDGTQTFYYAGFQSSQPAVEGAEEILFPAGQYLILSENGGLSRLAFDKLEELGFNDILSGDSDYVYNGGPVAEVLLNGNPLDAEVELWIPVEARTR
ncbi:GyrI-like domain-containing protein [Gorillibacterium massiliense]|uniref:GyrI-like domain-containing protein n=1 Tax=Gorillibacterium massiliense TaxID=1280390 RepID=UPI0004B0A56A|nr:GyrI-like domain-containing protein [Gorillibacterium massiliense]